MSVFSLIVISVIACTGHGYKTGAPDAQCLLMTPGHGGTPQTITPPYSLTVNKANYAEGDKLQVTLSKTSTGQFKGYLIEARDKNQNILPGFRITGDGKSLTCPNGNAVTHTENSFKNSVTFEFTAPRTSTGNITMYATVVKDYNTYWVKIPSRSIPGLTGASSNNVISKAVMVLTVLVYLVF